MKQKLERYCKCGCGELIEIKPHHKYVGIPNYKYNHHLRGKPITTQQREAIILSNKTRKISEKVKRTITKININRRWSEHDKQKISMRMAGDTTFRGYKTTKRQRIRQSIKYDEWRTAVFSRDNYICQITRERSKNLIVHHIEDFANNKKLRFNINNGITLLRYIHYRFHKKYGFKGCNKEQFEEFRKMVQEKAGMS